MSYLIMMTEFCIILERPCKNLFTITTNILGDILRKNCSETLSKIFEVYLRKSSFLSKVLGSENEFIHKYF